MNHRFYRPEYLVVPVYTIVSIRNKQEVLRLRGYGVILSVTVAAHSAHQSLEFPRAVTAILTQHVTVEELRNEVMHPPVPSPSPGFVWMRWFTYRN